MADGSDSKVAEAADLAAVLAQFDSQVADGSALWTQLEQFSQALPHHHSAALESSAAREKEELMAAKLLGEADLSVLFAAANKAHRDQHSAHMRWADDALVSVFGTDAGLRMLQQRTDLKPFLAAALDPSQPPSLHAVTIKALWALVTGAGEGGAGRANRCHWLLRQPVAAALVQCVGAGGTAASQGASGLLVDLLRWTRDPHDAAGLMLEVLMEVDAAQRGSCGGGDGGGGGGGDASTVVLRYADLVARCCAIGDKVVVSAQESGTLEIVLKLARGEGAMRGGAGGEGAGAGGGVDTLLRLNALELLPFVAAAPSGARFILTSGLSASLLELADVGARGTALGTGALRATAEVLALATGTQPSEKLALAQRLLGIAASYMKMGVGAGQEGARLAGMSAVADFARSSAWALQMVLEDNALCHAWLNLDGGGGGMSAALKAAALHSVARVLGPPTLAPTPPLSPVPEAEAERTGEMISDASETSAADVEVEEASAPDARVGRSDAADTLSELRHRLWLRLGGCNDRAQAHAQQQGAAAAAAAAPAASPVGLLMALVRLPVAETRHAAMDVLRCAAHQRGGWALQDMMAYGGLVEFLASGMGTDVDVGGREGMEWKFSLVESIMRCPDRAVLGQPTLDLLERILRNGPFGPPITLPFSAPQ